MKVRILETNEVRDEQEAKLRRIFTLRVRLTDAERDRLQKEADRLGQTLSEYARRKIFNQF